MVLADLGKKLNSAVKSLMTATIVDDQLIDAVLKDVCSALLESDVNVKLVMELRKNVKATNISINKKRLLQKAIFDQLCALVDPGIAPFVPVKHKSNVVLFVGLQGSGKTTTCTKLAYYYQKRGFKTGLVCTDTFRAGAFDQLKQNASKAKIPYFGSYTENDPVQLALAGVAKFKKENFEVIIVDTSGRHHQESELFEEMRQIASVINPSNVVFVLDGTIGQAADAHARAFNSSVEVGSIVITKMDGHAKGGGAISAVAATKSPILFIGTGEHIYDLEPFSAKSFISKMLGMGDISGLVDSVALMAAEKPDLVKKLEAGEFSMRDLRDQFKMIQGMGPLSKIASMLPGMSSEMLPAASDEQGASIMKSMMCAMDSMTAQELDSDGKIFQKEPSRLHRIAKGSGATIGELEQLLVQYETMSKMVKTMGGSKGLIKTMQNAQNTRGGMHPNQQAKMQSQMSKLLPPGMMEQLGGVSGLQSLMKQFDPKGDMSALQGMMGGLDMSALQGMMGGQGPSKPAGRKSRRK